MKYFFIGLGTLFFHGIGFAQTKPAETGPTYLNNFIKPSTECKDINNCPTGAYVVIPNGNTKDAELKRIGDIIGSKQTQQKKQIDPNNPSVEPYDPQWSQDRYAILIPQGSYGIGNPFSIGYYTQVIGLGEKPDDVSISPGVQVLNNPNTGNGLNNFWRSIENFSMKFNQPALRYAVSQASPIRRIHFIGANPTKSSASKFLLCDWENTPPGVGCGYTSGGFMADSQIDGVLSSASQQQWLTRNVKASTWEGGVWNMVFLGDSIDKYTPLASLHPQQVAGDEAWTNFPWTRVEKTPLIREKPYLICSNCDVANADIAKMQWQVVVPPLQSNKTGVDYTSELNQSTRIDVDDRHFFIVQPQTNNIVSNDDLQNMNQALIDGKSLIFMPGVYKLPGQIVVPPSKTPSLGHRRIILGFGLPTLICQDRNGNPCIQVDDEQGVLMGGIMFEAGAQSKNLLAVGKEVHAADNASNPNFLYDIYCRIAKTEKNMQSEPSTENCITIHTNNVVGDNLWLWRGDHDIDRIGGNDKTQLVKWDQDIAEHGLVVDGDAVIMYGLAVEHFRSQQTIWNGEHGQVYFYQSEMPYTLPTSSEDRDSWMLSKNSASYVIGENVKSHTAYGLGVYTYFPDQPEYSAYNVMAETAILLPYKDTANSINLTSVVGSWLDGNPDSGFKHLIRNYSGNTCWGLNVKGPHPSDKTDVAHDLPVIANFPGSRSVSCTQD